jgi:hypothetical protein
MIKLVARKGFFDAWGNDKFFIQCDCCQKQGEPVGEMLKDASIVQYSNSYTHIICNACFSKGIHNYRVGDYKYSSENFNRVCALCNKVVGKSCVGEINNTQKFICYQCAGSSHPDDKHSYSSSSFSLRSDWNVCKNCGTLRLSINGYRYWSTKVQCEVNETPQCIDYQTNKDACNHEYLLIHDFTENKENVKRMKKKELQVLRTFDEFATRSDYMESTCGYKLLWCKKCGQTKKDLPEWWKEFK